MVPADCELEFLDKAKWLDLYGADMHHVRVNDMNLTVMAINITLTFFTYLVIYLPTFIGR